MAFFLVFLLPGLKRLCGCVIVGVLHAVLTLERKTATTPLLGFFKMMRSPYAFGQHPGSMLYRGDKGLNQAASALEQVHVFQLN